MGRWKVATGVAAALIWAAPVAAQDGWPAPADAAERAALPDLAAALAGQPDLARLDALLARFPGPTPLRGVVQVERSERLMYKGRNAEAKAAAEEAVRLAPDLAWLRIDAAEVLAFAGAPSEAADLWLEASTMNPEIARHPDAYELTAILSKVEEAGDHARAERVRVRMDEIGVVTLGATDRSKAARARVEAAITDTDLVNARAAISSVADPSDLLALASDKRFAALWPTVEQWAGPDYVDAHRRFLLELRREFAGAGLEAALPYARRLAALRRYQTVVDLFLPLLTPDALMRDMIDVSFLAPVVARALAAVGRKTEAFALLTRFDALYPPEVAGLSLNASGNLVRLHYAQGEWAAAAAGAAVWIAKAKALGPEVEPSAIGTVTVFRACSLFHLSRKDDASRNELAVLRTMLDTARWATYTPRLQLASCLGAIDDGRRIALAWLADPATRDAALLELRPQLADTLAGIDSKEWYALMEKLRADPEVKEAILRVGRVPPHPVLDELPPGFDPAPPSASAPIRPDSA